MTIYKDFKINYNSVICLRCFAPTIRNNKNQLYNWTTTSANTSKHPREKTSVI